MFFIVDSECEVSSDLISSPSDNLMVVLVDGESVILLVEVEDLHQVAVTTDAVSSTADSETECFNGFFGSSVDFGWLEKFDFHGCLFLTLLLSLHNLG